MKVFDPILFDSNVLIYNQDIKSSFYQQANDYHEKACRGEIVAVLSSQNIAEFVSVMLNPKKVPVPLTPIQISKEINHYFALAKHFTVIYPNRLSLEIFSDLITLLKPIVKPTKIFDVFLVATMLGNGIKTLLTANVNDFKDFRDKIKIIDLKTD